MQYYPTDCNSELYRVSLPTGLSKPDASLRLKTSQSVKPIHARVVSQFEK